MGQVENTRTRLTRVGHFDRVVPFSDPIRSESLSLSLSFLDRNVSIPSMP